MLAAMSRTNETATCPPVSQSRSRLFLAGHIAEFAFIQDDSAEPVLSSAGASPNRIPATREIPNTYMNNAASGFTFTMYVPIFAGRVSLAAIARIRNIAQLHSNATAPAIHPS